MTLCSRAFSLEFLSEFENEKSEWEKIWTSNRTWNARMLGTGKSRKKGDFGLLGRIGKKFGYDIQAEWMRFDQVWYYYSLIEEAWIDLPWKTDVIIEHENNFQKFEYTLYKFEEASAPLKVGIFYPNDEIEEEALQQASKIINKQIIAYPGGVYLLIFGFINEKGEIYWHTYEIDFKGNVTTL